jgi:hypothetical protein
MGLNLSSLLHNVYFFFVWRSLFLIFYLIFKPNMYLGTCLHTKQGSSTNFLVDFIIETCIFLLQIVSPVVLLSETVTDGLGL